MYFQFCIVLQCASGRYTFEFVAQIMERLHTNPFQQRLLTGLITVVRRAISRLSWALKPPKKKEVLKIGFIDTLCIYLNLIECLVYAIRTIDVRFLQLQHSYSLLVITVITTDTKLTLTCCSFRKQPCLP